MKIKKIVGQDYRCDKKQDAMEKQESKTSNGTNNERLKIKKRKKKRGTRGRETTNSRDRGM